MVHAHACRAPPTNVIHKYFKKVTEEEFQQQLVTDTTPPPKKKIIQTSPVGRPREQVQPQVQLRAVPNAAAESASSSSSNAPQQEKARRVNWFNDSSIFIILDAVKLHRPNWRAVVEYLQKKFPKTDEQTEGTFECLAPSTIQNRNELDATRTKYVLKPKMRARLR